MRVLGEAELSKQGGCPAVELGMQRGQAVWAVTPDFFLILSGPEGVGASWGHSTGTPLGMWVLL